MDSLAMNDRLIVDFMKDWNDEENTIISIETLVQNNGQKYLWKCHVCSYKWYASFKERKKGKKCPYCSGKVVWKGHNDLATTNKALLEEWNYIRNDTVSPTQFKSGSVAKVWWKCKRCNYEWQARINKRVLGQGCPVCGGKKVWVGYNDIVTTHPQVAAEWDYQKNGEFRPEDFSRGSNKYMWWKCSKCQASWRQTISARTKGSGCPKCMGEKISKTLMRNAIKNGNTLAEKFPELAKEWSEKNGKITAKDVAPHSNKSFWWKCSICGYEWNAIVASRVKGRGCPECNHEHQTSISEQIVYYYVKQVFKDAINGYINEKISPYTIDIYIPSLSVAIEYDGERWHRDLEKDMKKTEKITAADINLIRLREKGCPVLRDTSYQIVINNQEYETYEYLNEPLKKLFKILSKNSDKKINLNINCAGIRNEVMVKYRENLQETSLGMRGKELVCEWDNEKNGALTPYHVKYKSNRKVAWICSKCGFHWEAQIDARVRGRGCPACAGKKIWIGHNDLKTKCPELMSEWNYEKNGILLPENCTCGIDRKVWWKCSACNNEWQARIRNRAVLHSGCPKCARMRKRK